MITAAPFANDPRTVARDIPGVLDSLFPQLIPGVVAHFNRSAKPAPGCDAVSQELIEASKLQRAMLFEIAVAAAEQLLENDDVDWNSSLEVAVERQRRHFDAVSPTELTQADVTAALAVAKNLVVMLRQIETDSGGETLLQSPRIPGFQWIASGAGDFAVGARLIEVKCTHKNFSSADYRQLLIYWLLGYAGSIEGKATEWTEGVLLNPRLNLVLRVPFSEVVSVTAGRSKVELLELFACVVGERTSR